MKLSKVTSVLGIAVFTIALGSSALAQTAGQAGSVPPTQTSVAKTKHPLLNALNLVNLTPDQKKKVNQILDNRDRDNKIFKKTHKGDKLAIQAHNEAEKKSTMDAIKTVLTPAQWQQLTSLLHRGKKAKTL